MDQTKIHYTWLPIALYCSFVPASSNGKSILKNTKTISTTHQLVQCAVLVSTPTVNHTNTAKNQMLKRLRLESNLEQDFRQAITFALGKIKGHSAQLNSKEFAKPAIP